MAEIKAIETIYNGYRFRSRLEARWAVFFDEANVKYEYEPEGFKTEDGICYLPDFYLPNDDVYVEVKPNMEKLFLDKEKISKCMCGNTPISNSGLLILGQIPYYSQDRNMIPTFLLFEMDDDFLVSKATFFDEDGHLVSLGAECVADKNSIPIKGRMIQEYEDLYTLNSQLYITYRGYPWTFPKTAFTYISNLYRDAFLKARQARFEHGEKG